VEQAPRSCKMTATTTILVHFIFASFASNEWSLSMA
jgi:hypothetical protein